MVANWTADGAARKALDRRHQCRPDRDPHRHGSLSYGELAGERMKLGPSSTIRRKSTTASPTTPTTRTTMTSSASGTSIPGAIAASTARSFPGRRSPNSSRPRTRRSTPRSAASSTRRSLPWPRCGRGPKSHAGSRIRGGNPTHRGTARSARLTRTGEQLPPDHAHADGKEAALTPANRVPGPLT